MIEGEKKEERCMVRGLLFRTREDRQKGKKRKGGENTGAQKRGDGVRAALTLPQLFGKERRGKGNGDTFREKGKRGQ